MARKNKIILEPKIENIPFSADVEEDIVLISPKRVKKEEILREVKLPWYTKEDTVLYTYV